MNIFFALRYIMDNIQNNGGRRCDLAVIGGGAAGMMAAGRAAELGLRVILFEKNRTLGKKLLLTGKGRCNVTNNCTRDEFQGNVPRGGKFLLGAYSRFSAQDTMAFFENRGIPLVTERGGRVFPASQRAADIQSAIRRYISSNGVRIVHDNVIGIAAAEGRVRAVAAGRAEYPCLAALIATGGLSYPATGSTGDGYRFASELGHTLSGTRPSLVPLEADQGICAPLSGLSLKNVGLKIMNSGGKITYSDFGELLFTHFGLSGPTILSASAHIDFDRGAAYIAAIDLKPALPHEKLDKRLLRDIGAAPNAEMGTVIAGLEPKSLGHMILDICGIDRAQKAHALTRAQRALLVDRLKSFEIELYGPRPIDEAVITSGGVNLKEIDPRTMESKIVRGLYFAGEVIDADAYTGGFNLQIAFCTARCAAEAAAKDCI